MNWLALALSEHLGGLMIVGAAVAFYVASRAATDALSQGGTTSATRHALAQWGAIACVALVAVWLDRAEIAVGVIFSTAVAALSLHLGVTVASTPETRARQAGSGFDVIVDAGETSSPGASAGTAVGAGVVRGSRAWAMVVPVAVLALMAGFSGKLTPLHAVLFALQGLLVTMAWGAPRSVESRVAAAPIRLSHWLRAQLALALVLASIGAVCAVYGAVRMSEETGIMSTGLIASAAIGPLLVLPMIGSASVLASQGQAQTAVGASVLIVLLNLCLLLPVVVAGWHLREQFAPAADDVATAAPAPAPTTTTPTATSPATTQGSGNAGDASEAPFIPDPVPADDMPRVLSFPIAVWRIDTVLLILLGLMLLPVSLNLWEMRRVEGMILIAIYACYLVATTVLGRRW